MKRRCNQSTYQSHGLIDQPNLFFLQNLTFFKLLHNDLRIRVLLWVLHQAAVELDEFLEAVVARHDDVFAFLYQLVFGLHFFVQMSDFCGKVGNCRLLV